MTGTPPDDPTTARAAGDVQTSSGVNRSVAGLADELIPLFYGELVRISRRERRRLNAGPTLQTTALVNEAYLRLRGTARWADERHFLAAAALAIRHALVNHARDRIAAKRGAGAPHVPITAAVDLAVDTDEGLVALHEALERLATEAPRPARIVECRYFAGYSEPETARVLGISERTVRREWTVARAWLYRELSTSRTTGGGAP
jgi:RNA polymerase sigma factor (TIGR02999 family)